MRRCGKVPKRRGVVLLVILGLLALFGMVAVTFIVITGHQRRAALTSARLEQFADPPTRALEEAMYQVIRGSENPASVLRHHGLLEDIYGHRGQIGVMVSDPNLGLSVSFLAPSPPNADGQLLTFAPIQSYSSGGAAPLPSPYQYVGCVITGLDGPITGRSTRIVDYDPQQNLFIALPFEDVSNAALVSWFSTGAPRVIPYRINGTPFSGTGVGYNSATGKCDLDHPSASGALAPLGAAGLPVPVALLPNPRAFSMSQDPAGVGGAGRANEDYDAADYQNMLLAMQLADGSVPEPSLHRPPLVNYWVYQLVYNWLLQQGNSAEDAWRIVLRPDLFAQSRQQFDAIIGVMARANMRPLGLFHPGFASVNSAWQAWGSQNLQNLTEAQFQQYWAASPVLNGPWDVDNDGDGLADSIWVDLGLPVRSLPDGRRYKPLFAILCVDLDGRLNLNAHGQLAHIDPAYYAPPHCVTETFLDQNNPGDDRLLADGSSDATNLPTGVVAFQPSPPSQEFMEYLRHGVRGSGLGPAEVNLLPLFEQPDGNYDLAALGRLLSGMVLPNGQRFDGRYGESALLPGQIPMPGQTQADDARSFNKLFNFPPHFASWLDSNGDGNPDYPPYPHGYRTPFDLRGLLAVGLDLAGQPLWTSPAGVWLAWSVDDPYELNLHPQKARGAQANFQDNAFSAAELERLLRPFDIDTLRLPDRLIRLLNPANPSLYARRLEVTTDSWDLPVPGVISARELGLSTPMQHPVDLVAERLRAGGCPVGSIPNQLRLMLAPELLAGLRMDLNRVLGNRVDDNGDGVVDEYWWEARSGSEQFPFQSGGTPLMAPLDHDNDGTPGANLEDPRHQYARSLYVLAMALTDEGYSFAFLGSGEDRARFLAQWAVNVIDFIDRDSAMTRFVYDPTPFDSAGWNPTGAEVVWGVERPELLLTEAIAFHDRRTEDRADYGYANPPSQNDPKEEEENDQVKDLDQVYRPQGSLFVEIYNPWHAGHPASRLEGWHGEMQRQPVPNDPFATMPVELTRRAPGGAPVWRLAITPYPAGASGAQQWNQWQPEPADPDDPDSNNRPVLERVVYFVRDAGGSGPAEGQVQFYALAEPTQPVLPGMYAVVGPGGPPDSGITYLGFENSGNQDPSSTRHIVCDPSRTPQFIVNNNGTTVPPGVLPPVAVMVGRATNDGQNFRDQRLSITEPVTGYADQVDADGRGNMANYNPTDGQYDRVIDRPLDARLDPDLWNTVLGRDVTVTRFRMVHLQRLADPSQPFDPVGNPYRTIDSIPVDLTSFNGLSTDDDYEAPGSAGEPGNPLQDGDIMFHTRERGEANDRPAPNQPPAQPDGNLWKQEPGSKQVVNDSNVGAPNHVFTRQLRHTLGYLNRFFGNPRNPIPGNQPPVYSGMPQQVPAWLTWFDRPLTSPLNLLLIPVLRSSKLLAYREDNPSAPPATPLGYYRYFRIVDRDLSSPNPNPPPLVVSDSQRLNPYEAELNLGAPNPTPFAVPYPHLANYFHSSRRPHAGNAPRAPELHRVLEFVRIPSPFVGTELQANPLATQGDPRHRFHPPAHLIPYGREPGKINLNTVFSETVWQGLLNSPALGLPRTDPPRVQFGVDVASGIDFYDPTPDQPGSGDEELRSFWQRWCDSRRGYDASAPGNILSLDPRFPTRFANPLRSWAGAWLIPRTSSNPDDDLSSVIQREVNATLLRAHPRDPRRPLFEVQSWYDPPLDLRPCNWNDTDRNPYFRYQQLMRLANLVTSRSNVYAVWITMGYFEVEPLRVIRDPNDPQRVIIGNLAQPLSIRADELPVIYPDGYVIGPELGSDTGEIKRHRMFFIVDRSIPVAFERGRNHNVDKAILVKTFIE